MNWPSTVVLIKLLVLVVIVAAITVAALHMPFLLHWVAVHIGSEVNITGHPFYNFWSGFGSDMSEFFIFGSLGALYFKHNCPVKGCWRIAKHHVESTPYIVCRTHHPDINEDKAVTPQTIIEAHESARKT